ncbi:MAG: serine O-acetyltransferase, partial [Desulfuromonadales bacterium]
FTVGDNSKIGSNSVVVNEVPPNSTVVGVPGRVVLSDGQKKEEKAHLEHGRLPDPEAKAIACLFDQIRALERKVAELAEAQERSQVQPEVSERREQA